MPGFYDEVRPLTPRDRDEFARMPFDERASSQADYGLNGVFGEPDFSPLERRGARPTLDVNGLWGGFQGEGSKTIIPAEAHAKVSCRLVADMDPHLTFERVRDYVMAVAPPGVEVNVRKVNDGMWSLTPIDHPATRAAAECLEEVFGQPPFYLREGGSIPAGATFTRDARSARGAARLHPARRQRPRAERVDAPGQPGGRAAHHHSLLAEAV